MSTIVLVVVCALGGAVLGALVPELVGRIPEPAPEPDADPDADLAEGTDPGTEPAAAVQPAVPGTDPTPAPRAVADPPKELYADMGALGWLRAVGVGLGAVIGGLFGYGAPDLSLVWLLPLVPVLVALSVIDARTKLLPKIVVLPATAATIVAVAAVGLSTGAGDQVLRALIAMVVLRSFYWVLWFIHSAGLGFGDVRYSALLGLVLGWVGWGAVAVGTFASLLVFVVGPLVVLAATRDRSVLKRAIAFGPFMTFGAVVGVVWGSRLASVLWG